VRAAVVRELGAPPEVDDVPDPEPSEGRQAVEVLAAGLNPIDIAVGSGRYYAGHPDVPYVPGAEAVARLPDGSLGYLHGDRMGVARNGAFAEQVLYPPEQAFPVPDGVEPALAVALGVAGLAGWVPLAWRAPVRPDDVVLVLGATGTVGLVAVQAARVLGAARVVAAGRNEAALERAHERGADATVRLDGGGDLAEAFREACGGDGPTLVHDPLWGEPAAAAVEAAARGARIVNLGQSAGPESTLRSGAVRGKQLDLYGYTNFAVPPDLLSEQYQRLCEHAARGDIQVDIETMPLDRVSEAWRRQAESPHVKLVIVPNA
jgi:NADPH:quinone reductase